jgi:hypothetical protein
MHINIPINDQVYPKKGSAHNDIKAYAPPPLLLLTVSSGRC